MTEEAPHDHREINKLIPWYVNGTIGDRDRQRIESHLTVCARCRDELTMERTVFQGMSTEPGVEYMPAASLQRLNAALDAAGAGAISVAGGTPRASAARRRSPSWPRFAAAAVVVAALALGVGRLARAPGARDARSDYHTVTTPAAHAPDEAIRAVFSPSVTLKDLQVILDEAGLRIVAGPSEAGVYSLAQTSDHPVSFSLALLRKHAAVRFAESAESAENGRGNGAREDETSPNARGAIAAADGTEGDNGGTRRGGAP